MNVLHIVLGLNTGGLEYVVLNLLKNRSSSTNPVVCCLNDIGDLRDVIDSLGVQFFELKNYGNNKIKTILSILEIIKNNKIDIIHTHNPSPHLYGCFAGFISGKPVIHTKHGRNCPDNKLLIWRNRLLSYFTKKIVCVSDDAKQIVLQIEKVPENKVVTILNGVDIKECSAGKDLSLKTRIIENDRLVVGVVARLSEEKNHVCLIKAFSIVLRSVENATLIIVGDGPLRYDLETMVKDLDLIKQVIFLGARRDVPELLTLFDVFVLSSISEGISLTLLEAMVAKLPIVCTDVGGNREVVVDGETGMIVPSDNFNEMAEKIILLLENKELRERMGLSGYKRVCEKFNIIQTVEHYENLYGRLLKGY